MDCPFPNRKKLVGVRVLPGNDPVEIPIDNEDTMTTIRISSDKVTIVEYEVVEPFLLNSTVFELSYSVSNKHDTEQRWGYSKKNNVCKKARFLQDDKHCSTLERNLSQLKEFPTHLRDKHLGIRSRKMVSSYPRRNKTKPREGMCMLYSWDNTGWNYNLHIKETGKDNSCRRHLTNNKT